MTTTVQSALNLADLKQRLRLLERQNEAMQATLKKLEALSERVAMR